MSIADGRQPLAASEAVHAQSPVCIGDDAAAAAALAVHAAATRAAAREFVLAASALRPTDAIALLHAVRATCAASVQPPATSLWPLRVALEALADVVEMDVSGSGRGERGAAAAAAPALRPGAPVPLSLDALLLHLLSDEPRLRAALRQRCRAPHRASSAVSGETAAVVTPEVCDEAVAAFIRCAACAVVAYRELLGGAPGAAAAPSPPIATSRPPCTALSLLQAAASSSYWCSTGCAGLDAALGGGGFRSGWLTEVYGEAGAGKTQLLLQSLLQQSATAVCHAAVALALANSADFVLLAGRAAATSGAVGPAALKCRDVFGCDAVEAVRCALLYVVSEDVPTARLGPLAAAAADRALRTVARHPLLTQLPAGVMTAVMAGAKRTCTVPVVLSRLHIRHVTSLADVLRLTALPSPPLCTPAAAGAAPAGLRCDGLVDAVRLLAGTDGRAVVVLDSIAAAAASGRWDVHGAALDDATAAAVGAQLRQAAVVHNWCIVVANQVRAVPTHARQHQHLWTPAKRARSPTCTSSASARAVVPALGFSWATAPHSRVLVRKALAHGVRQLILRHAPSLPPAQASFTITESGVEDA
ncbi:Rad51/recA bacterial DNA recombination protein [Novymonas esmeraldas]|uniref:Rad51/recA bacterial DNA recombination protein n=1 Tax=Novymonas esmeraldas TaxID=1808958 RepID=A0AAW0EP75_9TRYP